MQKKTYEDREIGKHDGRRRIIRPTRQALPELLGDEGHEGMQKTETEVQASVEGLLGGLARLGRRRLVCHRLHRLLPNATYISSAPRRRKFWTHDVDIAELVEPEVVDGVGRVHEIALSHLLVGLLGSNVELAEDPALDEALLASGLVTRVVSAA